MASLHQATELDSGAADSLASTPTSEHHPHHLRDDVTALQQPRVRFMCSFGGKILPRPHDNQLRYVGGDTRIVAVHRHITFSSFLSKLSKLSGTTNISIKYQLPSEELDSLITVTTDEDIENMMEEYDRLSQNQKTARLRLFLFPTEDADLRSSDISSLLDGSAKRQNWFLDALNVGSGRVLERGRSEVSSVVSEVPDYLFGLDNSDEATRESRLLLKSKLNHLSDNVSVSDPGSPAPVVSSPFCSTSPSVAPPVTPVIPDLPPVRTKPVNLNPTPTVEPKENQVNEVITDKTDPPQSGYVGAPMWHYPGQTVQHMPAVYYVPGPGPVQHGSNPFPQVPIRTQYIPQVPLAPGQLPVGYPPSQPVPGLNQVHTAGMIPYEMPARVMSENGNQTMFYGTRNAAAIPGNYPGMVVSGGEEMPGSGTEGIAGWVSHGS